MIDRYKSQVDKADDLTNSITPTAAKQKEVDHQKLKRYAEVNASVEEHLRKFEYLIPDLRKK